jgi:hypothetical protein
MLDMASTRVQVEYANLATINKLRAYCRRHNCSIHVTPYTKGAWEGYITVPSPWNEGTATRDAKVADIKAIVRGVKA